MTYCCKIVLLLGLFLAGALGLSAQEIKGANADDTNSVYATIELKTLPEYPGGEKAMYKYLAKKVNYPQQAIENNISGQVMIRFIVERDGSVSNVECMKGLGSGCEEEVMRVIREMPKWKPAKDAKDQLVRSQFQISFTFNLN